MALEGERSLDRGTGDAVHLCVVRHGLAPGNFWFLHDQLTSWRVFTSCEGRCTTKEKICPRSYMADIVLTDRNRFSDRR